MKKILLIATMVSIALGALAQVAPISVRWEMGTNEAEKGFYSSRFIIKNVSGTPLAKNWQFYFNQFSRRVKLDANCPVDVKEVSTTYYQVTPNSHYTTLAPGEEMVVNLLMRGTFVNICYSPMGGHVVMNGDTGKPIPVKIDVAPLDKPGQFQNRPNDYPDCNRMYAFNATLKNGKSPASCYDIFPTPKSVTINKGYCTFSNMLSIDSNGSKAKKARQLLTDELHKRGIYVSKDQKTMVKLHYDSHLAAKNAEYYELVVKTDTITITANATEGLMNGVKTLIAAIDRRKDNRIENAVVKDYPDFGYRGFMPDIARNFTTFDNIKKEIDILSYYKINKIQFHFTDDEAWRVEIPGLPEFDRSGIAPWLYARRKRISGRDFRWHRQPQRLVAERQRLSHSKPDD